VRCEASGGDDGRAIQRCGECWHPRPDSLHKRGGRQRHWQRPATAGLYIYPRNQHRGPCQPDETEDAAVVLNLFLIGLAVTLDPLPLTAFLVVLPSKRGARKGAAFTFGWLLSLALVVAITALATGNNPPRPKTAPSLAALAVKIALGAVLVVIAARRIRARARPKPPKKPPKWQEHVDNMSPRFALGLAPALQPWVLIGAGAATVVNAKLSSWESFLALFLYCILASGSYLALEIYAVFRPDRSQAFLARSRAWIDTHTDQAIIAGSLILGLWLMGNSIYLIVS
jgi:threonine/homoserine/homoserine lactone efflux protein